MSKKVLLITLIVLLVVLGVAGVLYPKISAGLGQPQLATTPPTAEPTEPEPAATTEATAPAVIPAPEFTALDWDGNEVRFSDYVGKPLVLNFWAYWCGPCKMEMPEFNEAYQRLNGEVTFLMVHGDPDTESGKAIVAEAGYTFPVLFDESAMAAATYGITAFPTTFFVDREGNLQAYYMGAMDADLLQQGIDLIYTAE